MRKLVCGDTTVCVRVSVVLPPFLKGIVDVGREEQYLARQAEEMEIEFKNLQMVYANSLGEMNPKLPFMLNLLGRRAEDDEAVVIFYSSKLNKLLAEEGALERELKRLAQINPDVVFITEPNANHNHSNFVQRLEDSFPYYFHDRVLLFTDEEEKICRGEIGNIVGCEGKNRVARHLTFHQWRSLFLSAAFMIPIRLQSIYHKEEENGCLVSGDRFQSAWKFNSVDHFDPSSFNSRLRDINPVPPLEDTLQPIPVLKEHSLMNQLAASAEIYDMLEGICFKHDIPLALTWVCGANTTVSNSYQKLTLSLESASSYYINYGPPHCFMRSCSENNLEAGQGIAGNALQSNEPFLFEPDITRLDERPNYPFARAARKFGSHAVVAICLQNNYTDDVYVLEFFIPSSMEKPMTPESLALHIFDNLCNMKKRFVTLRNHGSAKVDFQKEDNISNINQHVAMPMRSSLPASYEGEIRNALPFNHDKQQWGETTNFKIGDMQAISLPLEPRVAPILMRYYGLQQMQGPHDQLVMGEASNSKSGDIFFAKMGEASNSKSRNILLSFSWVSTEYSCEMQQTQGPHQQWGETSNSKTGDMQAAITLPLEPRVPYSELQQKQGPLQQENENHTSLKPIGNNEIKMVKEADHVNELPASYEGDEIRNALLFNHNQQGSETSNYQSVDMQDLPLEPRVASSSLNGMVPILMPYSEVQQTQGPLQQENEDHTSLEPIGNNEVEMVKEADHVNELPTSCEADEIRNAYPFHHNQQWGETSNSKSGEMQAATSFPLQPRAASSSLNEMVSINTPILMPYYGVQQTQGPHDQLVENGNQTSLEPIGNNEIEIVKEAYDVNELPVSSAKKRKLTSNVWDEFNKVPYNDPKDGKEKVWAICSHCKKKFDGSSKKGTTHLRNHLNRCKIRGTKLVIKDSELTLLPARRGSEPQSVGEGNSSFDQDRSRMDIARMFIKFQFPLNMVEDESFSNFVKNLQPMFKVQSQEALSSDILRVYQEEKGRLIEYFDKLSCRLNLVISLWTDDREKVTNSCFAVQFVDDNWVLKKNIIAFKSLRYENEFSFWPEHKNDIEPKIFLETLESLLVEWKFDKKLCSLTIRNFASSSLEIDEEMREIWNRFEASYPLSTFCISFDGSISDLLAKDKASVTKTPSACLLQDIFNAYKKQSRQEKDCPLMNVKYDNNWRTCSLVLAIAAILDPRLKFDFVEYLYKKVYGKNSARDHLEVIRSDLTKIFNVYASNFCGAKHKTLLDDTNSSESLNAEENILESFQKWRKVTTNEASWKLELDKYLQEEPEPLISSQTDRFEVLSWWGEHASEFPVVGRMARGILAIPMSTVIQGSSFDEKVMMDNPVFKGLAPQIIEAMICCKDWLESPKGTLNVEPNTRENTSCPIVELKDSLPLAPPSPIELSSESDEEAPPSPMELESSSNQARAGLWSEKDVRTYLISPLTGREMEYLSKWQTSGVLVGSDTILDKALASLLEIPPSDDVHLQNPQRYYIDDRVVNQFFILLKRRSDKFPHKYLKHHSFNSHAMTKLFRDQNEDWSSWVKPEELKDTRWVFLPMCLKQHWLLFCADIDNKNLLWLDSLEYSQSDVKAYVYEKEVIRKWFKKVVLPAMDQPKPNDIDWSYIIPTKVPLQKNSVDCGLFVMKYADCLTHGNYFPFTQDDMPHFRRRTFLDLCHGRIHSRRTQGS